MQQVKKSKHFFIIKVSTNIQEIHVCQQLLLQQETCTENHSQPTELKKKKTFPMHNTCIAQNSRIAMLDLQDLQQLHQKKNCYTANLLSMLLVKKIAMTVIHISVKKKNLQFAEYLIPHIICIKITTKPINFKHQ